MDKDIKVRHEEMRKKLWIDAWVNVAGASNCTNVEISTKWADKALHDFDLRFPMPKNDNGD